MDLAKQNQVLVAERAETRQAIAELYHELGMFMFIDLYSTLII